MFNLMPRDKTFFDELEQLAGHVVASADALRALIGAFPNLDGQLQRIDEAERAADDLSQETLLHLDAAFITPLDREDIFRLVTDLASVVATIAGLARRFKMYKLREIDAAVGQQADLLGKMVSALDEVIHRLRNGRKLADLSDRMRDLHAWERDADEVRRKALGELFEGTPDPIDVMKRRELLDLAERAIDGCDAAVRTLQRVILKNS